MFEPDAETVTEALEWLRNNQNDIIHSYDSFGDQENEDIQLEAQDESMNNNHRKKFFTNRTTWSNWNINAPSTS